MNYISEVEKEIKSSGEELFFTGRASELEIKEFESLLGVIFPKSFKDFLRVYGTLSFCGDTYYGITQRGKDENQIPCILFATQEARANGDISDKMVKIKSSGYGPSYSIDMDVLGNSGEPVVVETELSYKRTGEKNVIADSYGEFLLSQIKEAVEDL